MELKIMTRINVVPVSELTDKHLLAEYRELPRVYKAAVKYYEKGEPYPIPSEYRLGEGHVKFFYDKLQYINLRHNELIGEMNSRGFKTTFTGEYPEECSVLPDMFFKHYEPTDNALEINRKRISDRINGIKS